MQKIIAGTAPERFTYDHLNSIGITSSSDRSIIPLLKELGFLTSEGVPTQRYHEYRNTARSKKVLGNAIKEAYQELFHINARPTKADRNAIEGMFKSIHNVTDRVAELQAMTFFALLDLADISGDSEPTTPVIEAKPPQVELPKITSPQDNKSEGNNTNLNLRYNIEIHLPATKDVEVYNAIFKSLKENLVD